MFPLPASARRSSPLSTVVFLSLVACSAIALAPSSASAQALTWGVSGTGGPGTWNTTVSTTNWFNGTTNINWPTSGTGATFSGSAGTVTVSGSVAASSLTFTTRNYTLTGGTINLTGTSTPTITLATATATSPTATIASILTGSQGLRLVGSSTASQTLNLSGSNTFTGGTVISGSSGMNVNLLTNANALGSGTVTLSVSNSGPSNVLTATNMVFSNPIVLNQASAGGGRQGITASGTLSGPITMVGTGGGQHILQTPNTVGPSLLVTGNISGTSTNTMSFRAAATNPGTITLTGTYNNPAASLETNGPVNLIVSSTGHSFTGANIFFGTLTLGTNNALPSTAFVQWTGTNYAHFALNGFNQTVAGLNNGTTGTNELRNGAAANSTLTLANLGSNLSYAGPIVDGTAGGTLALVMNSPGRQQTLSGTNVFTGGLTVVGGTLQAGSALALGAASAPIVTQGGVLDLGGFGITRTGTVSFTGGTVQSGTLTNNTVVFDGQSGTVSAALAGSVGLTKTTSGTLTLSGNNTYSGPTTVSGGALAVNGVLGTGTVSVAAAAWLQGTGTIGGPVAVDGTLSPGNAGAGVFTLASTVLGGTSTTQIEINGLTRGTQYDGVNITGTSTSLTYGGALSLAFGNGSAFANGTTFDVFNFLGGFSGAYTTVTSTGFYAGTWTQIGTGTYQLWSGGQSLTFSPSTGDIIVVPEPAGLAVVGLGIAAAVGAWRRRRRQTAASRNVCL
jgi:fibronectin-binding autotransporter adhesin